MIGNNHDYSNELELNNICSHFHSWNYNQVKDMMCQNGSHKYTVIRFCVQCYFTEEIELSSVDKANGPNHSENDD